MITSDFMRASRMRPRLLLAALAGLLLATNLQAESFTKAFAVDFFRDVPSRKLKGLAARSDGRLLAGPVLKDLGGKLPADLVWCIVPGATADTWYAGTGPEGVIFEISLDASRSAVISKEIVKLDDSQVYALVRLADGSLLAGTSPKGSLVLIREGKVVSRIVLPVDSVLDILPLALSQSKTEQAQVLVSTGNPGMVYRIDVAKFAKAGISDKKISDVAVLASKGVTLFGEVRDRNIRRLALMPDGRVIAGSAPKGNIYAFPSEGGAPVILMENKDAEVTDLLVLPDGGIYASIVVATSTGDSRINRGVRPATSTSTAPAPQGLPTPPGPSPVQGGAPAGEPAPAPDPFAAPIADKFAGRGALVYLPFNGFPEILVNKSNQAFYKIIMHGGWLLAAGGEQGDLLGYDPEQRMSLVFAGSSSAQLTDICAIGSKTGRYLLARNNPGGFSLLDFNSTEARSAETRRLDFGILSSIGALRIGRLSEILPGQLIVEARASAGSDELEGWTPWETLKLDDASAISNVGWLPTSSMKGRHLRLKLSLPAGLPATASVDKAYWFHTPQNRRPVLSEFRTLSPDFSLVPAVEAPTPTVQTLSQALSQNTSSEAVAERKKSSFLGSQIIPAPGMQVFLWTVADPDGDALAATFSIRLEGQNAWDPIAVETPEPFTQVSISNMPEGVYHTRLVVAEQAPRPKAERLSVTFETDDFIVDRTAPEVIAATARVEDGRLWISVHGKDALSLLEGIEVVLNNGIRVVTEQPVDGIRDSKEETFELDIPLSRASGATQCQAILYDAVGNHTTRLLRW